MPPLLGGTWGTSHVGPGTPLMTAGGVTPIGSRTASVWQTVQLGLAKTPLEAGTGGFTWSPTLGTKTW